MNTIPISKCSTIAMVNGGERTHPTVVHGVVLKQWVGIGWINLRKATQEDKEKYPSVSENKA